MSQRLRSTVLGMFGSDLSMSVRAMLNCSKKSRMKKKSIAGAVRAGRGGREGRGAVRRHVPTPRDAAGQGFRESPRTRVDDERARGGGGTP